jgi:hypothetical protein
MKTIIIKLLVIMCCGDYNDDNYKYETRSLVDTNVVYTTYSTTKYNVGDTIQYQIICLSK